MSACGKQETAAELRDKNLRFACSFQLTALIFLSANNKQDDFLIT
jgi:hypothetical protein